MQTKEDIQKIVDGNDAVVLYFSAPACNVCHALKPKLIEALNTNFSDFKFISIDVSKEQETAAHFEVFSIPATIVFLGSKEFVRKSRNMSVDALIEEIRRPYEIMHS